MSPAQRASALCNRMHNNKQSAQDIHTSISMATRPLTVQHGGNLGSWQQKHPDKKRGVLPAHNTVDGIQAKPFLSDIKSGEVKGDGKKHVELLPEKVGKKGEAAERDLSLEDTSLDIDQLLKDVDLTADLHMVEHSTTKDSMTAEQPPASMHRGTVSPLSLSQAPPPLAQSSDPPFLSQPLAFQPSTAAGGVINPSHSSEGPVSTSCPDALQFAASVKIQRWYRSVKSLHHQSQVLTLLREKKALMAESMQGEAMKVWDVGVLHELYVC